MLDVTPIAVENELPVAQRLAEAVRRAWPGIAGAADDHVDILVGLRTPVDVDILILIDLAAPRIIPAVQRRDGTQSPSARVQHALIAVEVKQLDGSRFTALGNQLFPDYRGEGRVRSVSQQAKDASYGIKGVLNRHGLHAPFVHALAWLTEVDEAQLRNIEPSVLGQRADWWSILDAAAQQQPGIYDIGRVEAVEGIRAARRIFMQRQAVSSRDRARAAQLTREAGAQLVDELAPRAGHTQIRLFGRGGSGKTTTLALLAKRLAIDYGDRVLILTFHRTLRSDIEHVLTTLVDQPGVLGTRIQVTTMTSFLLDALAALGGTLPMKDDGVVDYGRLDGALDETRALLIGGPDDGDAAALRTREPEHFDWDHVFVDEAQDWTDAERDFLRVLFGHRRVVLTDGLEQLIRRQTPCDWTTGIPKPERIDRELGVSLRMMRHLAAFANAAARAAGLPDWRIRPSEDLPGGRIVIAIGEGAVSPEFITALDVIARAGKAEPVDCLICVPPDGVLKVGEHRRAALAETIERAGYACWDGSDSGVRDTVPESAKLWRIVQYDSCRGLEGWITVATDLDVFYEHRLRYPNFHEADAEKSAEKVARRWLMTALTRAVQTLVITIRDPDSAVASILREATAAMPLGVVEWTDAAGCVGRLGASDGTVK